MLQKIASDPTILYWIFFIGFFMLLLVLALCSSGNSDYDDFEEPDDDHKMNLTVDDED